MLKNYILAIVALIFVLIGMEGFLRVFPSKDLQVNDPYKYTRINGPVFFGRALGHYQEVYPLEFDPRGYYRTSNGVIDYFNDQYGGRWNAAKNRKLGKDTAIFLGDSFTYGFGLRYEDSYVYRLSDNLLTKGRRVDMVNLSQPAANVSNSLKIYQERGPGIPHRLLIYGLYPNKLIPFPTSYALTNPLLREDSFLQRHSRLAEFLAKKWDMVVGRRKRIQELTSPAGFKTPYFLDNFNALQNLQAMADAQDIPFRVILLPWFVDLRKGTFEPVYAELRSRMELAGIECIDLTQGWGSFRDSDLWITPFDQHPNEVANRIFAERLIEDPSLHRLVEGRIHPGAGRARAPHEHADIIQ